MLKIAVTIFICLSFCANAMAWSEGGHHLIARMAFGHLSAKDQDRLVEIIKKHPRFDEDFKRPAKVTDAEYNEWLIGRAAFWPDAARMSPFDRPNWHYQLGSSMTIGDVSGIKIPDDPSRFPKTRTMADKDMHIVQAFELCQALWSSPETSDPDRAVALCWILHLAGDAHQPCHAGALYEGHLFPSGDRGGNSIPTVQSKNLHSLWDGLLGPRYNGADVRRRIVEIESSRDALKQAVHTAVDLKEIDCTKWIQESRTLAKHYVYAPEVIEWIAVEVRSQPPEPTKLKLTEQYLKQAGKVAQLRAIQAADRLQKILMAQ